VCLRIEDLSIIGNCQYAGLVSAEGGLEWCCLPRFDSEPVFGRLLDPDGGVFSIGPASGGRGTQRYIENTNVLETTFDTEDGSFRVLDFAPRFVQFERTFRPTKLVRIVESIRGSPRIQVRCEPVLGWSKGVPARDLGSHHISYRGMARELRLTTDVPISYVDGALPFVLHGRRCFVLSWGDPVEEPLEPLCESWLGRTVRYWEQWVKHCVVPPKFQQVVIRSALALKLHCFEDTGAIVASITTSLPESPGSGRTWDYRYCWLRDAYYALDAFRMLGHFEEREGFVQFLLNVASSSAGLDLAPLYRVDGRLDLDELIEPAWRGYQGEGPVRVGNAAVHHHQHDVYGEMVLALAPVFLDDRFKGERTPAALDLLTRLAHKAIQVAGQPDASIWELRTEWTPQTFSSLMCWAAADRTGRILLDRQPEIAAQLLQSAESIREEVLKMAWDPVRTALVSSYGGTSLDAALLQAAPLRFLEPFDPRLVGTIEAIRRDLLQDGWLLRYRVDDGFGHPTVAFVICTFWLVQALAVVGRTEEAQQTLERALSALSPTGLLAEDWDPVNRRMWGNFPQAYSHVGLIRAAFAASPSWWDVS
jgi:GH15 family glucan-1,4-alpha-glucosidase